MGTGIIICGLNGCGKSTLGKALAEKLFWGEIRAHENFVFTSVKGDYGDSISSFFSIRYID